MSFLSRLFARAKTMPIVKPDDKHLTEALNVAKQDNATAASDFAAAAHKQGKDADMASLVIREILSRTDRVKAIHNANPPK